MNVRNEGDQSLRLARASIGSNLLADYETVPVVYLVPRVPGAHGSLLPSWQLVWPPCGSFVVAVVDTQIAGRASSRRGVAFSTGCRDPKTGRDLDRSRTHQCECWACTQY